MALALPSTIGPFEIQRLLGMGATAQVYLAHDPTSNSPVAVKALHPHLSHSPGFAAKFEHELITTRMLDHPRIARVVDHGCEARRA
jgi:eukaryotic-like serine/threonine-protein kinase